MLLAAAPVWRSWRGPGGYRASTRAPAKPEAAPGLGKVGKLGLGALDNAAAHVAALPKLGKGAALAAHVTPEGHWKFANREGQVFTAATPDELARVSATLAPEAQAGEKLALYLSEDTVFAQPHGPQRSTGRCGSPRRRRQQRLPASPRRDAARTSVAEVRPNIALAVTDRTLFERGDPPPGPPAQSLRHSRAGARNRRPSHAVLRAAFRSRHESGARRSGRPVGAAAGARRPERARPPSSPGGSKAARSSSAPRRALSKASISRRSCNRPRRRTSISSSSTQAPRTSRAAAIGFGSAWRVAGLDDALQRATFADFLASLGDGASELMLKASPGSHGRVVLSATPQSDVRPAAGRYPRRMDGGDHRPRCGQVGGGVRARCGAASVSWTPASSRASRAAYRFSICVRSQLGVLSLAGVAALVVAPLAAGEPGGVCRPGGLLCGARGPLARVHHDFLARRWVSRVRLDLHCGAARCGHRAVPRVWMAPAPACPSRAPDDCQHSNFWPPGSPRLSWSQQKTEETSEA